MLFPRAYESGNGSISSVGTATISSCEDSQRISELMSAQILLANAPAVARSRLRRITSFSTCFSKATDFCMPQLPDGRFALGQGHFFVIRPDFPRPFRTLKRRIADFREIKAEAVTHLLPPEAPWRRLEARVRRTAYVENTAIVVTATKETIAGVYLGYWTCANALGRSGRIYISSETTPFYVEDSSKRVVMIIAPSRLSDPQRALIS